MLICADESKRTKAIEKVVDNKAIWTAVDETDELIRDYTMIPRNR